MGCNVKLLFWRQIHCQCSLHNFVLHVMSHVYAYLSGGQVAAFGKGGILHLPFRKTRWHIAAFALQQMCHLLYLKGATEGDSEPVCYWRTLWITCVWLCWPWLVWSKGVSVWEKDQHIAAATETCMLLGALQSARKCLDDIRLQHNSEATVRLSIMSAATWEGKKQVCKFHETLLWRLLALPTSRVAPDCG